MLQGLGEFSGAARISRDVLEVLRRLLGAKPPRTLASAGNLVSVRQELDEVTEAARISCATLEMQRRVFGKKPQHALA